MAGAFSTQASIEARISVSRLEEYTAFDGSTVASPATVQAAIDFAWSYIYGKLKVRFGEAILDAWVLPDDVPDLIKWLSDSLCIYSISISRPELFPEGTAIILDVIDVRLDALASGAMTLPDVDAPVGTQIMTERTKSDFDPERIYDNQSVNPHWVYPPDARNLPDYPE